METKMLRLSTPGGDVHHHTNGPGYGPVSQSSKPLFQRGQGQAVNLCASAQFVGDTHAYLRSRIRRLAVGRILASFNNSTGGAHGQACIDEEAAQRFAEALLLGNGVAAATVRNFGSDAVLLWLIPDIARRLGSMWDEDRCSFFDVTLALHELCGLVHEISIRERRRDRSISAGRSILLTSVADNQHMLGLLLVEAAFNRSGWNVLSLQAQDDILDALRSSRFEAVGLSISCACNADEIADLILAFRHASLNSAIVVLVGGAYCTSDPDAAVRLGADATADDASLAVAACGRLVRES